MNSTALLIFGFGLSFFPASASDTVNPSVAPAIKKAWALVGIDWARGSGPFAELRLAMAPPVSAIDEDAARRELQRRSACIAEHIVPPDDYARLFQHGC